MAVGTYGAAADNVHNVRLCEQSLGALFQIAGWGAEFEDQVAPLLRSLGFVDLGDYGNVQGSGDVHGFRIAPHRLLIRHRDPEKLKDALAQLDPSRTPTLDLSHARIVIALRGPGAEHLLARLATPDLSSRAFPAGRFVQTAIHHTSVLIHHEIESNFLVYLPTSWAASLWDYICLNAEPLGYEVANPE